jgi:hypothetical protein
MFVIRRGRLYLGVGNTWLLAGDDSIIICQLREARILARLFHASFEEV